MKTYSSFNQILCSNVNNSATNGLCRVKTKGMVLVPLPWVKILFCIDCSLIYCARNSNIDQLADSLEDKGTSLRRS